MKAKIPFVNIRLRREHLAAGPCPRCGRLDTWLHSVPLRVSCWGPEHAEHKQWSRQVPANWKRKSSHPVKYRDAKTRKIVHTTVGEVAPLFQGFGGPYADYLAK